MNNITPAYRDIVRFASQNRWVRAAMIVGGTATAAVAAIYLKNLLFPNRHVTFSPDKVIEIQRDKTEAFPSGYFVQHPDKGPIIAIVEKMSPEGVVIRFQDDKDKIEPGDYQFIPKEEFDSWRPAKIW